jgi:hypothetical protein
MVFELESFHYLYFWSAATNALIFWELIRYFNAVAYPQHISQGHWVVKFIHLLPRAGPWTEICEGLRQQVTGLRGFAPFTYRGLVEFLMMIEGELSMLGEDPSSRQIIAHQVIYDALIEPAGHLGMPAAYSGRQNFEVRQMNQFREENPEVDICWRMAKLWYRWVETKGVEYPRGPQGTWIRIRELVTLMPRIEVANTDYIATLLAPTPPPPPSLRPPAGPPPTFSSEGSYSVTGPYRTGSEERRE